MKRFNVRLFSRLLPVVGAVTLAATVLAMGASAAAAPGPYANGFESAGDTEIAAPQPVGPTEVMFNVDRVPTGTYGIDSASGSYHAVAGDRSGKFTRYGGYSSIFPNGGYTTSADIYLDTTASPGFDWSTATSDATGGYDRDFVFNVGPDGNGHFVVSASNNAGVNPANPDRSPYTITTSGWYTFKHKFTNVGGVLAAELTVRPLGAATPFATWTLSEPTDVIGTVGGNRYGWLLNNTQPIALDNVMRSDVCTPTGFIRDEKNLTAAQIGGNVTGTLDATGCDIGVYYGPGAATGSVTGATIANAKYFGVVNYRGHANVTNSTISQIGDTPFNGSQHGVGILYTTDATDRDGVTEGTARGTISGNVLHSYQKGGITVRGAGATAKIQNNTLTGSGQVAYIAQNGIQVSFKGTATVKGNTVSGHDYTGNGTACGLLFYQADKDAEKLNTLSNNEVNVCIVH